MCQKQGSISGPLAHGYDTLPTQLLCQWYEHKYLQFNYSFSVADIMKVVTSWKRNIMKEKH